jgi:hypothetical protein
VGGIPGRPPNWVLQRRLCQAIIGKEGTPEYAEFCAVTRRHLLAGILPPAITTLILHYGYGKPVDEVEVEVRHESTLASLSEDELRSRARRLAMAKFILPPEGETIEGQTVQRELQMATPETPEPDDDSSGGTVQ